MTLKPVRIVPPRASVLLALVLVFLTGGIRLGEWTLCLEMDGRVHSETGSGDCASDGLDHDGHEPPDAALTSLPISARADCDGCLDITGRSLALRLRNEGVVDSPATRIFPLASCSLPIACPIWFVLRTIGEPYLSGSSRLTLRSIDSVILTC